MPRPHRGEGRPLGRQTLLDRIVRLRRADAARLDTELADELDEASPTLEELHHRVVQLERVVEDLQDSLHRRSVRQDEELDELRRSTRPAELARALAQDARARGL